MSCSTLNQSAIQLDVSVASLPEGFCPSSMQDLANAIGARIIISPSSTFNTFAIGSTAPTSNVGPWLKDCSEWFVFNDATATYIPITKGGFNNQQYSTASGVFVVPDFIYKLKVQLWGGGGAGSVGTAGSGRGGGGAGGYGLKIFTVTPGQSIAYTIGAGGVGGSPGSPGGSSTFLTMTCAGGAGAPATIYGGVGGAATGGDMNVLGAPGGPADNSTGTGGTGGGSSNGGGGGTDIAPVNPTIQNGQVPGGGGGGTGGATTAGNGAGGGVLIQW